MKGLKKVALASAIAAVSAGAQAELKALDDSAMGELTGQAGLTIDVETEYTIGEFVYHDTDGAGMVVIQDIALGGNSNEAGTPGGPAGLLDNFRMTIDVANGTEALTYGFSEVRGLAALHAAVGNGDTMFTQVAGGTSDSGIEIDDEKVYGDGDLVIHFGFTDAWQKGGGLAAFMTGNGSAYGTTGGSLSLASASFAQAKEIALKAVDFQFDIGALGIAGNASSTDASGNTVLTPYEIGSKGVDDAVATAIVSGVDASGNPTTFLDATNRITDATSNTTTLLSDISFKGFLGPEDLHIENNGNGFSGGAFGPGTGDADSKITWGSYFNVTDLDLYIDIAGVAIEDIKIHNSRGDVTGIDDTDSFGFAHSIRTIYAVNEAVIDAGSLAVGGNGYTDGVAINTEFKGDMDIGHLSFGDEGKSIGKIYLTDIESTTNWTISAH